MSEFLLAAAEEVVARLGIFRPVANCIFSILISIVMIILVYVMISRARRGEKIPEIRKIPGIEAFVDAIGRATEMGKPVHMTDYSTALGSDSTFAYWSFLAYIAKQCAQYDTRFIATDANYLVNVVNQEIAYRPHWRPANLMVQPDDVRSSRVPSSLGRWVAGLVGRENRRLSPGRLLLR